MHVHTLFPNATLTMTVLQDTCIGFQGEAPCFNKVIKSGVKRCVIRECHDSSGTMFD